MVLHVFVKLVTPYCRVFFFLMIRRPPRSTLDRSSAASDVYKRQALRLGEKYQFDAEHAKIVARHAASLFDQSHVLHLSLIHISEPTRPY